MSAAGVGTKRGTDAIGSSNDAPAAATYTDTDSTIIALLKKIAIRLEALT